MAKKIQGYIRLQLPAGAANPAPPVGPALGAQGVNIKAFCKEFNAKTKDQNGMILPVIITVYADKSFSFILKSPPASVLLKKAAIDAGADHAGLQDMIAKINEGWLDFDVAIATTEAMKTVRTIARVLGPKGLMPNPKSGTVTDDVAAGIKAVKAGRVEFKMDKTCNIGVGIGKRSFTSAQILENLQAVLEAVGKAKPAHFKGHYIKSVTLSSSQSPSVRIASTEYGKY